MRFRGAFVLVGLAAAAGCAPQTASAEYDGQPVELRLPYNAPLTETLTPSVHLVGIPITGASDFRDVQISASLRVGKHRLGVFDTQDVHVVATASPVNLRVPATIRSQAITFAKSDRVSQATVSLTIKGPEGGDVPTTTSSTVVSLKAPVRTTGPTPIKIPAGSRITGAFSDIASGTITATLPTGLLRTSAPGSTIATFTRVPVDGNCTAEFFTYTTLVAVRSFSNLLEKNAPYRRVRFGHTTAAAWQINAASEPFPVPSITAVGGRQIAPRRWAAFRIYATFTPGCPISAARQPALLGLIQHAVSNVRTDIKVRHK